MKAENKIALLLFLVSGIVIFVSGFFAGVNSTISINLWLQKFTFFGLIFPIVIGFILFISIFLISVIKTNKK